MKILWSHLFPLVIALTLMLSSIALAAQLVPHVPPPPIYRVLNSRARVMGVEEFLKIASIDVNTANCEQLEEIPSIGEKLSERIIQYREANGDFTSIEQLDNIKGIGEKTIRIIREYAYIK